MFSLRCTNSNVHTKVAKSDTVNKDFRKFVIYFLIDIDIKPHWKCYNAHLFCMAMMLEIIFSGAFNDFL